MKEQTTNLKVYLSVREASMAVGVSTKAIHKLIKSGKLHAINLGIRMTRISLQQLLDLASDSGFEVEMPSSLNSPIYNKEEKGDNKAGKQNDNLPSKPKKSVITRSRSKVKTTVHAGDIAPEGITHEEYYTLDEICSKYKLKYGRLYDIRKQYKLQAVHAWGTTCIRKEDADRAIEADRIAKGKDLSDAYYTCFDLMQLYGLGKTQVRRFAETHGVRIKQVKGGRANYYLKADWEEARRKAEKTSASTKSRRESR